MKQRVTHFKPVSSRLIVVALLSMVPLSAQSAPTLYKWIDEDGQVRYSDRLEIDQAKKRHQTMDKDGRVIETRERQKTPEELRKEREEAKQREEAALRESRRRALIQAAQDQKDRVLMMTYTSEDEIRHAEKERIEVLDSVIQLLRHDIDVEQEKLEELKKSAKTKYLDKNQEVPGGLAQKIEYFQGKLLNRQRQLKRKLSEKEQTKEQYANDLLRYRELSKQKEKAKSK